MNHRIAMITAERTDSDERIYHRESKALVQSGWRVEIINPVFEGKDSAEIRFSRMALPENAVLRFFAAKRRVISSVRESRADICVLHDISLLPVIQGLKSFGVQTVVDIHESECKGSLLYALPGMLSRSIYCSLINRYLPLADGVIAANSLVGKRLSKLNNNIVVVHDGPTGCDKALFECARQGGNKKGYSGGTNIVAKDLTAEELIRFAELTKAAEVILLAMGKLPDKSREALQRRGLTNNVKLLGKLSKREEMSVLASAKAGISTRCDENAEWIYRLLAFNIPVVCQKTEGSEQFESFAPIFYHDGKDNSETVVAIKRAVASYKCGESQLCWNRFSFESETAMLISFFNDLEKRAGERY